MENISTRQQPDQSGKKSRRPPMALQRSGKKNEPGVGPQLTSKTNRVLVL